MASETRSLVDGGEGEGALMSSSEIFKTSSGRGGSATKLKVELSERPTTVPCTNGGTCGCGGAEADAEPPGGAIGPKEREIC